MRKLLKWIVLSVAANALALYVVQYFLQNEGFSISNGVLGFALVGLVLGLLNTFVRPLLKLVSMPLTFLSMGLFLIVINAVILFITQYLFNNLLSDAFGITFMVGNGIVAYIIATLLLSVANTLTHWILK